MEELVRAAKRGDAAAMAGILRALAPYVGRICGAIALDEGDDAMQETMIAVLRNLDALRDPAAVRGWVRRIAVREAVRIARRRSRVVPTDQVGDVGAASDAELRGDVRDLLSRLSPEQRAILVLRDVDGLTEAEAARALDLEPGTVKSRLHRARAAFRKAWTG